METIQITNCGEHVTVAAPPLYNPSYAVMMAPGPPPPYGIVPTVYSTYQQPQSNLIITQSAMPVVTTHSTMVIASLPTYYLDYLGYSIFTMLCCFLPLGIAALVFSVKTRDCNRRGDGARACANSKTALILNHVSLSIGLAYTAAYISYVIFYLVTIGKHRTSSYYYGVYYKAS